MGYVATLKAEYSTEVDAEGVSDNQGFMRIVCGKTFLLAAAHSAEFVFQML